MEVKERDSCLKGLVKRIVVILCFPSMFKRAVKKASWPARCCSPQAYEVEGGEEASFLAEEDEIVAEILSSEGYQFQKLNARDLKEVSKMTFLHGSHDDKGWPLLGSLGAMIHEADGGAGDERITLPEDLVERILAMVPFPHIFKARALSKSWLARFSPVESHEDKVMKHLATSFQRKVSESSSKWKTLCPVFIDSFKGFSAYDRASCRWLRMPPLSFIPLHLLNNAYLQMEGSLLLMSEFYESELGSRGSWSHELCVANVLTRTLRRLPHPPRVLCIPEENCTLYFQKLVSQTSLGTYKVAIFYISHARGYYLAQIYDSRSNVWKSKTRAKNVLGLMSPPAYLNGDLYMVAGENPTHLLALNVEEGTFEELEVSGDVMGKVAVGLVVCNAELLMLVKESRFDKAGGDVLRVDLGLRRLLKVGRGPAPKHCMSTLLSDGNCILIPFRDAPANPSVHCSGMVVYNVQDNKWDSIRFHSKLGLPKQGRVFSFQPNLNPFMAV